MQTIGIGAAVIGIALLLVGYFIVGADLFFRSYLFGFYFTMGLALGSLGFLMLQHLTGGAWGVTVRRMLEAGALVMPVMGLLFIPIILATLPSTSGAIGMSHPLYEWANPAVVTPGSPEFDPGIYHKVPWMSPMFFTVRSVIYFVLWSGLAFMLRSWSVTQDRKGNEAVAGRMRMLSGIGLALFVISITFASFDWTMSLDPHWFSSMYGVQYMVSSGLIMLAFLVLMFSQVQDIETFKAHVTIKPFHDISKLLLGFTVLWTYVTYMQYNIIWSGDVAEFTPWYVVRTHGGWLTLVPIMMLFQFFLPFFLLLSRRRKQNVATMAPIAALIILMRVVDISWIVLPAFHENIAQVSWMHYAALVGLTGIWLAIFAWNIQRVSILPLNDPNMEWLHVGGDH
ncbi:hypothetical protein [Oscillochloris sp. ZM17-4]|uniref:hypothetical protein n=1 Tax=Oscillochloris sp. ZM17-4 TaxID=2866714 RepID=UPI0021037BD1|nr:hypothetical protein [Oscillochloris sp. ZM17-4]